MKTEAYAIPLVYPGALYNEALRCQCLTNDHLNFNILLCDCLWMHEYSYKVTTILLYNVTYAAT